MSITIHGLTLQQKMLAEILWQLNRLDEVDAFIDSLPTAMRDDAVAVKNMILAEVLDSVDEVDQAKSVLEKYRLG